MKLNATFAARMAVCSLVFGATGMLAQTVTPGTVTPGNVTGGSAKGGNVTGSTVTGGDVTGGDVTGGDVTGGSVTGATVKGGDVTGGNVSGGTVTPGSVSASTATATINGREITARVKGSVSIHTSDDKAVAKLGDHTLVVEKERVLLDGKEQARIPADTSKISIESKDEQLSVRADGKELFSQPVEGLK